MKQYTLFYEGQMYAEMDQVEGDSLAGVPNDLYVYKKDGQWFYYDYLLQPIKSTAVPKELRTLVLLLN